MTGIVCGPMTRSTPSVTSGLPARPMPTIRPSLMPMSALTTPTTGSTTSTPATRTSSSEGPAAPSCWTSRERMVLP